MKSFNRHPKALPFLFLTEMWERFGFYVVQGMLVLYMTEGFGYSDDESYIISGMFAALAYISPMLGGFIADRLLGFKTAIAWGGILLSLGYAMMALPWPNGLYISLATIIAGNGLFKPNISCLLGTLYTRDDTARDAGFTIFYIGINLGIFLAGITSGAIKNHFGWHAGFALASIGLILGLCIFITGIRICRLNFQTHESTRQTSFFLNKPFLLIYILIAIYGISLILQSAFLSTWLLPCVGIFLLFFIFGLAAKQQKYYRDGLILLNMLSIASVIFWMLYLQMFFSGNLFIDRLVDKIIFGWHIPTTAFYALEGLFLILLGPFFAWTWQVLNHHHCNPSPFTKFILAILMAGIGFAVLTAGTYYANDAGMISPLWIMLSYLFITIGELLLSPIGLSAVTLLSPPKLIGMMMGIWFVALGFGGEFGGMLAKFASIGPNVTDHFLQLQIYRLAFFKFSLIAAGVSVLLFLLQLLPAWKNLGRFPTEEEHTGPADLTH